MKIGGLFSPVEFWFHMNLLEHRASRLELKAFLPSVKGRVVQMLTDNTTTMC